MLRRDAAAPHGGRANAPRCSSVRRAGHHAAGPAHPLWQFHLVEDYEGGSALIARIHHCIGDGIALISVMMSHHRRRHRPARAPQQRAGRRPATRATGSADAVLKPLTDLTVKAIGMYGGGVAKSLEHAGATRSRPLLGLARHGAHRHAGGERRRRAGADARRFAHPAQGQAGGPEGRGLERADAAGRGQGRSARRWAARSTTCCWPAWPAPSAHYLRDARRRPDGQGDPRHGAGQPAAARARPGSSATASAWRRWCCRSASTTRSSASTRCARA